MTRHSKEGRQPVKARRRKTTRKPRNGLKTVRRRSTSAAGRETKVTRLTRELKEAEEQQTATAEVLNVVSRSTLDLATILNTLVETAARLCRADKAQLLLPSNDARSVYSAPSFGYSLKYNEYLKTITFAPGREGVVGRVLLTRKPVQIADVLADPEYRLREIQRLGEFRTHLGLPLLRGDSTIGILLVSRVVVQPFENKHIELLTTFAAQAVIAIENARLLNELRESLQQQTATADVLKVISRSTFDLKTVLGALVESAARLCKADKSTISRQIGGAFYRPESFGFSPEFMDAVKDIPVVPGRDTAAGRALLERKAVQIPDVRTDPDYSFDAQKLDTYRTIIGVPMLREGVPIGVLTLTRSEVKPFTDKQIELVTTFANQAAIAIENVRLFEAEQQRSRELTESLEQQTATSEVLEVISSSQGDLQQVFETLLRNATRLCEGKFGTMDLCEGKGFRLAASYNVPSAFVEARSSASIPPDPGGLLDGVMKSKATVHLHDLAATQLYAERHPRMVEAVELAGMRTTFGVPMLKQNELIGVIAVYRQEVRPFTDKQIELMQNFAAQAVIAIDNARLLNELRESLQQQTATADVLKVISRSTFDLQPVFDSMAESAVRLCEAERAYIFRFDGKVLQAVASFNAGPENQDWVYRNPIPLGRHSVSARAGLERRTVQVTDIQTDPEYHYVARDVDLIRTTLAVPMLKGDELIGTITIYRLEVKPFTENQIALMETFADQAVIAIENARLFEAEQQRTRELAKSLDDLRTAQDRLVHTEKLASLGQLTAGIAHEIKNPLNFVNNFSGVSVELIDELEETLAGVKADDKTRTAIIELASALRGNLDKIVQHGKRADAIVKNMLLHSHEGSGEHRPVNVNNLVEESLNLAYHGARAEKQGFTINLEQSFDPTAGEFDVFPQDITRALLNLISNGFYAATKRRGQANGDGFEPTVRAATKNLGDRVEITIRDNGAGIPPAVREKMFNPFFTTKPAGEGTGLGLSISHDIIVKQHAGSIEVETQLGEFIEFKIILPRIAASLSKSGR